MNLSYAVWLTVSGAFATWMAWMAWQRRAAPGAWALFILMLALIVWSFTYAAYWLAQESETRVFWLQMTYLGAVAAPVAFFVLVLSFAGRGAALGRNTYLFLAIVPVLTLLFLWTDPWHGLFFGPGSAAGESMIFSGGPWFYVNVVYSYGLMLAGVILLGNAYFRFASFYRRQVWMLLAGAALPWLINILMLLGWNPLPGLDLTPIAFTGTGLVFAYGFFGYRLMDLTPIARDLLVETLQDGIIVLDLQDRVVDINARALELASPVESPIGKPLREVFAQWKELIDQHDYLEAHFQLQFQEHPYYHMDINILSLRDKNGNRMGRMVTWRDITDERKREDELRIFRHALEQSPLSILITDGEGIIQYVNRRFTEVTGYSLADVTGKTPRILKSGETPQDAYRLLWDTIKRGKIYETEVLNRKKDGSSFWANEMIAPVLDAQGKAYRFISMQQDITERKRADSELRLMNTRLQMQLMEIESLHAQLREEAIRDGLTRLFNRRYMEESLDREISRSGREPFPVSAVMMDVDLFKTINDTHGHQAGDTVLQTIGALLLENTRISDIACRYGGDEMVVVMPGATLQQAAQRAEEWRTAFSMLEFTIGEVRVKTTLSLGIASFPEHAVNPNELLGAADRALYRAKIERNKVVLYDPAMQANPAAHGMDDLAGG
ncbi:MAG: hypothetical protein HFACDABA_02382 [Anaerolineales bacterium]|nr:hypothetical protein [Anaerolineales bacterium]